MKKVIISQKQLNYLNENSVNISAQAKDNSLSSFSTAATDTNAVSDIQKAQVAGDVNLTVNGPNTNDTQPVQQINVAKGDTIQNALATQGNDELIRNGGAVKITGDGIGESVCFTKKQIEEIAKKNRLKNIGHVVTKNELLEFITKNI